MKLMLVNRTHDGNYAKNYASTIYQSLFTLYVLSFWSTFKSVFKSRVFDENALRICVRKLSFIAHAISVTGKLK